MSDMSIQERYDQICEISGLSEDIVRRVFKATRQSIAASLKRGKSATLPGICTITPELRNRICIGGESMSQYVKLKAKASTALNSELEKISKFEDDTDKSETEGEAIQSLNIIDPEIRFRESQDSYNGVITNQISALL